MTMNIKMEIIPYPIKFMFGGFFVIIGGMLLLTVALIAANNPAQLGKEIQNLLFGNFKTATSVLTLVIVLIMTVFYVKSTTLTVSDNRLLFSSSAAKPWQLDISSITKIVYSITPAKQKFTLTVGQANYTVPFRVIDPDGLIQLLKSVNSNIQIETLG